MPAYSHIPVLLQEVLQHLEPKADHNYVDATLGGAGYTKSLLSQSAPHGKILAIDLDEKALEHAAALTTKTDRLVLAHGNFRDIDHHVKKHAFKDIDGIVADIGLSSYQLDQSGRGISFQKKELLDMRFDISSQLPDARFILNHWTIAELTSLFADYGEEKYSSRIAKEIVHQRESGNEIKYTTNLNESIQNALPKPQKHFWQDAARRIYQALRIEVNHELENLEVFLPKAFDLLNPGGRLVVVTFHSLEDRIVKNYFKGLVDGCVCPNEFPICKCGFEPKAKLLTKKIITATEQELQSNMRAKPAKLRAIQKLL